MEALIIFGAKYAIGIPVIGFAAYFFVISPQERVRLGKLAIFALPLAYILARLAGLFYSHPQPFVDWGGEPLVPHEIDNAFPSDHVLLGASLGALLGFFNRYWSAAVFIATALIALARVGAGLHDVFDVIASFVFAGIAVWAVKLVLTSRSRG